MHDILLIGGGGFLGSTLRYKVGVLLGQYLPTNVFPWPTFIINIAGCFLVGALVGFEEGRGFMSPATKLLLVTGFLGGFTTFSAFGLETFQLIKEGSHIAALTYVVGSVSLGILALWLGHTLG